MRILTLALLVALPTMAAAQTAVSQTAAAAPALDPTWKTPEVIAFMGVNLAAFMRYFVRAEKKQYLTHFFPPLLGFVICFILWLNLSRAAMFYGSIWMLAGIAYGAWKTQGFRGNLVNFDVPAEE